MPNPQNREYADNLLRFLNASPTAYHATAAAADILERGGFAKLREEDAWDLKRGGRYYVKRNNSAVIAFEIGDGDPAADGFRLIGAHTDSPGFKIKPGGCMRTPDGYIKIDTEGYGSAILSTWFDRPLSIAGRVALKSADPLRPNQRLVDLKKPVAVIPNLCLHFNREVNSGYAYNKQIDLLPLFGLAAGEDDPLLGPIAVELGVPADRILDFDLFLYEFEPGRIMGPNDEFISAARIDNLSMVYAGIHGLLHSDKSPGVKILAAFDNEEVGSRSAPGADSSFLDNLLRRMCACLDGDAEAFYRSLARSLAISADCAHAVHPNHPEKHDPLDRPVLGGGPAIKYSAAQRYSTTAMTAAAFAQICDEADVPYQKFSNRSDMPGGSTIGPAMSSLTSAATVDVGTPILAMHSIRELGGVMDNVYAAKAFAAFFGHSE